MAKLIGTIFIAVIVSFLIGYNLDNRCDIWIFHTFKDVHVFYAIMASFIAGVLITLIAKGLSDDDKKNKGDKK